MKHTHLIHNPGAGSGEYSAENLLTLIRENGYLCGYSSTENTGWEEFHPHADFLIVAGGDGTIRKLATHLLTLPAEQRTIPIAVLPLGTANNIARTLGVMHDPETLVAGWKEARIQQFDVGSVSGIKGQNLMMESFGYGIFPYLMREIEKEDLLKSETPRTEIRSALEVMHDILQTYKPRFCKLNVDGSDFSGKFILAEVMNIRSIGPLLNISPHAHTGDEEFEVVLVPGKHKQKLIRYLEGKISGKEDIVLFHTLKGKKIKISWEGTHVHVDDKLLKIGKGDTVKIRLQKDTFRFLVPGC